MPVTGFKSPGTITNEERPGNDFTNPGYAAASDDSRTIADVSGGGSVSDWLRCVNFGFTTGDIPDGAVITGIEVTIEDHGETTNISDSAIYLRTSAGQSGNNKATNTWTTSDYVWTYGGDGDMWGTSYDDADIRDSTFGVDISATNSHPNQAREARIDHVQVRIYYSTGATVSMNPAAMAASGPALTITPGPITKTLNAAALVAATFDLSVTVAQTIQLGTIAAGAAPLDLTVSQAVTENMQVGASSDDAEQGDAAMYLPGAYIRWYQGSTCHGGFRFVPDSNIPQGSTISSATFSYKYTHTDYDTLSAVVWAHDTANPGTFTTDDNNISSRAATTQTTNINDVDAGTDWIELDVTAIVQELATSYTIQAVVIVVYDATSDNARTICYDGSATDCPKLDVIYTPPAGVEVSLDTAMTSLSGPAMTITPGAITKTMATAVLATNSYALSLTTLVNIALNAIAAQLAGPALTVTPGAVTKTMSVAAFTAGGPVVTVTPGAISINLGLASASFQPNTLSITSAIFVTLNAMALVGNAPTLTVTPGAISTTLNAAASIMSGPLLTVTPGAISTTLNTIQILADAQVLTVTPGAVAVTLAVASMIGAAPTITITPGVVTVTLNTGIITSAPRVLNVVAGIMVAMNVAAMLGSAPTLTVTPGAVSITFGTIPISSTTYPLSVLAGLTIALSTAALAISGPTITITPGVATVVLNAIQAAVQSEALTVTPGAVQVLLDELALAAQGEAITITPGAISVMLGEIAMALQAGTLNVQAGAGIVVMLGAIAMAASAGDITLVPGVSTQRMRVANVAGTAPGISITPGGVSVSLESIGVSLEALVASLGIILAQLMADVRISKDLPEFEAEISKDLPEFEAEISRALAAFRVKKPGG